MNEKKRCFLFYLLFLSQLINALPQSQSNEEVNNLNVMPKQQQQQQHLITELDESVNNKNLFDNGNINTNNNYNNNEWSERNKLLFYTLGQFALLSNFTVTQGSAVLRNVLKEASTLKEPTEILQAYLQNFTDYIARAEHLTKLTVDEQLSELYAMVVQFTELVERHNTTTVRANATTENMYLEMLLKKNGLDKLQVDFLENFLIFIKKFNAQMDNYLEKLTDEQRVAEQKMIDWYRTFNDETDSEKKVEIFTKFFELYA